MIFIGLISVAFITFGYKVYKMIKCEKSADAREDSYYELDEKYELGDDCLIESEDSLHTSEKYLEDKGVLDNVSDICDSVCNQLYAEYYSISVQQLSSILTSPSFKKNPQQCLEKLVNFVESCNIQTNMPTFITTCFLKRYLSNAPMLEKSDTRSANVSLPLECREVSSPIHCY